jgi:hypothetical protein
VTIGLILFGAHLNGLIPAEVTPMAKAREQARIAPEGAVYAGATGAAAQAAATAAAQAAAASGTLRGTGRAAPGRRPRAARSRSSVGASTGR